MPTFTPTARAALVDRRLEELYPETPIPLDHRDAYSLLVAVVLSAQCTDKRVNEVTPALFALAGRPDAHLRPELAAAASSLDRATFPARVGGLNMLLRQGGRGLTGRRLP